MRRENKSRGLNQIKITENIKRKRLYKEILKDCKTWSGPYTSEKLIKTKKLRPKKENFNVKTEMAHSAHTHYPDKLQQPELYKLNGISFEEKLENRWLSYQLIVNKVQQLLQTCSIIRISYNPLTIFITSKNK